MTDKEKAEEYVLDYPFELDFEGFPKFKQDDIKKAYLDGFKAGREAAQFTINTMNVEIAARNRLLAEKERLLLEKFAKEENKQEPPSLLYGEI